MKSIKELVKTDIWRSVYINIDKTVKYGIWNNVKNNVWRKLEFNPDFTIRPNIQKPNSPYSVNKSSVLKGLQS